MKLIFMLVIGYFAYRVILQPLLQAPKPPSDDRSEDLDYTDYEEIE